MRGAELAKFDPKWRDVPHYINGITHEIWEGRRIGALTEYYAPSLIVRSPASIVIGNQGIIAATLNTLAEFPDRKLFGEDVIWHPASTGFLSSHRLYCTATHSGAGAYGPPTGRKLAYRILADCYCAEGAVQDEWLVRDQGAIVQQMGHDIVDWTRAQIAREGGPDKCVPPFTPDLDQAGPYQGHGNDDQWGTALVEHLQALIAGDAATSNYSPAAQQHLPLHDLAHGPAEARMFWEGLRAALPSADLTIHHVMGPKETHRPPRAAVRWSLDGRHDGQGRFGAPTGAPLHVMGITHAEFGPSGIIREWSLIDDTAIWRQILLKTGAV